MSKKVNYFLSTGIFIGVRLYKNDFRKMSKQETEDAGGQFGSGKPAEVQTQPTAEAQTAATLHRRETVRCAHI